jgi:hypothetical protein
VWLRKRGIVRRLEKGLEVEAIGHEDGSAVERSYLERISLSVGSFEVLRVEKVEKSACIYPGDCVGLEGLCECHE